jgi:hypothetical protein
VSTTAQLVVIQKPPFNSPCNRCGEYCRQEACPASVEYLHSEQIPCIALEIQPDGTFVCGLMLHATRYIRPEWAGEDTSGPDGFISEGLKKLLAVGRGCGMQDGAPR